MSTTSEIPAPSFIERTFTRLLMHPARVGVVETLSANFRSIELTGEALRGVSWSPGDKIQIKMDGGIASRTYTPVAWNAEAGFARLICACHAPGPGSAWVRSVQPGDERHFFGPRSSMALADVSGPLVLFGDETSVALAAACAATRADVPPLLVLEANDPDEVGSVLDRLGLRAAAVARRENGDVHLPVLTRYLLDLQDANTVYIVTGRSSSVRHVLRLLKSKGIGGAQTRAKVYWADGKTGLD